MDFLHAGVIAIIEGFTEFLPVSSTAHILMVGRALGVPETDFFKTFAIAIQLGAIFAVGVLYFGRLVRDWDTNKKIVAAFFPTAVVGYLLYHVIKNVFFENIFFVSIVLGLGGVLLIALEYYIAHKDMRMRSGISYRQAFAIGCAQSLAVIPGVSRAAATIIGGMLVGVDRATITEFSFLLAVPTMAAATGYDIIKSRAVLNMANLEVLVFGFFISFVSALVGVRFLIRYVKQNSFISFGVYRILIALLFIIFVIAG